MFATIDPQQFVLSCLLVVTFVLLMTEKLRIDLTAILIIISLPVLGLLEPEEALSGLGSEPAIVVAAVFVLSGALYHTGLSDRLGIWITRFAGQNYNRIVSVLMLSVASLSAFTHHLTITAIMLPVTLKLCEEKQISPSRLLMPVSFAASLGTTITVIGAPAFLIAGRLLEQAGRPGLSIFAIAPIGISITIVCTGLMLVFGRFLLPDHQRSETGEDHFRLDRYYSEILVLPESDLVGKRIEDIELGSDRELKIVTWMRAGQIRAKPYRWKKIKAGDVMLVRIAPEELASMLEAHGLALHPVVKYHQQSGENGAGLQADFPGGEGKLVQAVIGPGSDLIGNTVGAIDFLNNHGALVVGLWRRRGWPRTELSRIKLREGDVLVLLGDSNAYSRLHKTQSFLLLAPFHQEGYRRHKAPLAAAIMVGTVLLAAFNLLPVEIALLAGAAAAILTGCLTISQAYRSINIRIYVFIAGAIPLGLAMVKTGLSDRIAAGLSSFFAGWPVFWILLLLFAISALMTQLMSDAGTTVLLGPIAIALAIATGMPPEPFVLTVAIAAVASFLTPIGHHGNLLIYGPGGYEFKDFIKAGVPLTVAIALIVVILAPIMWPV